MLDLTQAVKRGLVQTANAMSADGSLRLLTFERLIIGGEIGIALTWEVVRPSPSDFRESFALVKVWGDSMLPVMTIPVIDSQAPQAVPLPAEWSIGDTITRYFVLQLSPGQARFTLRDGRYQLFMPAGLPFFIDGIVVRDGQAVASATDWQWGIGRVLVVPADHAAVIQLYANPTGTDLLTIRPMVSPTYSLLNTATALPRNRVLM